MSDSEIPLLKNIRIVLVETSHTGNVGSVARAMKTMGISELCLVNPIIKPDSQAIALAAGASDIIHYCNYFTSLEDAISDCQLVVATSARKRSLEWRQLTARENGEKVVQEAQYGNVAVVFGRERVGLTNEELQKCHYHVNIPANSMYSSLNLAMAVQLICYEIRMAVLEKYTYTQVKPSDSINYPESAELEHFYQHLSTTLQQIGFIKENHPGLIMSRLRRLFTRARLEQQELNILRGVLTSIANYNEKRS